jgi:hypothetical protein
MTLGLSISGAVFVNTAKKNLFHVLSGHSTEAIEQLLAGASSGLLKTLSPELRRQTLEVIVSSWQDVFICVYVAAALSFLVAICLRVSFVFFYCKILAATNIDFVYVQNGRANVKSTEATDEKQN